MKLLDTTILWPNQAMVTGLLLELVAEVTTKGQLAQNGLI
jgi:hypothetical protein